MWTNLFKSKEEEQEEWITKEQEEQIWHIYRQINTLSDMTKDSNLFATYLQRLIDHGQNLYREKVKEESFTTEQQDKINQQD